MQVSWDKKGHEINQVLINLCEPLEHKLYFSGTFCTVQANAEEKSGTAAARWEGTQWLISFAIRITTLAGINKASAQ